MFGFPHPLGQGLDIVVRQDRDMGLHDGRAAIQFLGDEVHGGAMLAVARFQRPLMGMQANVPGEQRRVDVQQSALIAGNELRSEDTHEAGQDDQLGLVAVNQLGQRPVVTGAVREVAVTENGAGNTGPGCALQTEGIGAVGDHRDDIGLLRMQAVYERLQIAA